MNRNLWVAFVCLAGIIIITLLSALPIGFARYDESVPTLQQSVVAPLMDEGQQYYGSQPGPTVYRVTFVNTFLPRQYVLPRATACLWNSKKNYGVYTNTRWQISSLENMRSDFSDNENVVQIGREPRTVELNVDKFVRWKHKPGQDSVPMPPQPSQPLPNGATSMAKPVPAPVGAVDYPEGFDTLLLFLIEKDGPSNFYPQCENLQLSDLAMAKKIALV